MQQYECPVVLTTRCSCVCKKRIVAVENVGALMSCLPRREPREKGIFCITDLARTIFAIVLNPGGLYFNGLDMESLVGAEVTCRILRGESASNMKRMNTCFESMSKLFDMLRMWVLENLMRNAFSVCDDQVRSHRVPIIRYSPRFVFTPQTHWWRLGLEKIWRNVSS